MDISGNGFSRFLLELRQPVKAGRGLWRELCVVLICAEAFFTGRGRLCVWRLRDGVRLALFYRRGTG